MRIENESTRRPLRRAKKENKQKPRQHTFFMFISVFFVLLLIFLGFAKVMSPDVDIAIGDETQPPQYVDNYQRSGNVDDRLKALQMEDDEPAVIEEEMPPEDDGVVKIPETTSKISEAESKTTQKSNEETVEKKNSTEASVQNNSETAAPAPGAGQTPYQEVQFAVPEPSVPAVTARVVVGSYNTAAQATVAKSILQESGLGVTPHIRQLGGVYTLQVGAYSSKESAQALANKLLMNNYPARVVMDSN